VVRRKSRVLVGDLRTILSALHIRLQVDYEENQMELAETACHFEYVVSSEGFGHSAIAILTRIYSEIRGNIFYGCVIARTAVDRYSLWVDPD